MRVTQSMIQDSLLSAMQSQRSRLDELQAKVVSQKAINKPSEDPVAASQILNQRATLTQTGQYLTNVGHSNSQLNVVESTLNSVLSILEQARNLAIAQSNAILSSEQRAVAGIEMAALRDQVLQLANTEFGGRFIFAGRRTDTVPFSLDGSFNAVYAGDNGTIESQVAQGSRVATNSPGSKVFQATLGTTNIFTEMQTLITALTNNDVPTIEAQIGGIDNSLNQINLEITDIGARTSFLNVMQTNLTDVEISLQISISGLEDVDLTKAISDLAGQQSALEVSMAVAARILPLSLMNFL